jgi:raffinose/stachyose/melibiose transport system substrate-binding protein
MNKDTNTASSGSMSSAGPSDNSAGPSVNAASSVSRRKFLGAAGLSAAAVGLAACSSGGGTGASGGKSTGKATLNMWSWYTEDQPVWASVIDEFHAKYPNIQVVPRTFGSLADYSPALEAAVSAGSAPDIFAPATLAISYGKAGIVLDLKSQLGSSFINEFFPSINQEYADGDKQYAIGWEAQMFRIFYNPDILKKAKVDFPETWDDLITASAQIRSKTGLAPVALNGNPSNNVADFYLPLVTQASNNPNLVYQLDNLSNGTSWNSQYPVEAFQMMQKLQQNQVFESGADAVTYDEALALFYTQKSAMLFFGSFIVPGLLTSASPAFNKLYKVGMTPSWTSGARHWGANQAGAGWSVNAQSPNVDAALEWLKFIYEPSRYATIMQKSSSMAATMTAAAEGSNPIVKEMASWITDNGCNHILFGVGSETAVGNAAAGVLGGKLTPTAAAAQTQSAVETARHA